MGPELISSSGITVQVVRDDGGKVNPEMIELAKRAVACRGWRWLPGMLGWRPDNHGVPHSIRFVKGVESMEALAGVGTGPLVASGYATCDGYWRSDDVTPDLTDPATLGCLISLIQESYNKKIVVSIGNGWWSIQTDYQDWDQDNTSSILEALTLAMESR